MVESLKGKKTYIVALGVAGVTFAYQMQWIDEPTYKSVLGFLNSLGLMTLSAKMNRVDKQVGDKY